MEGAVGMTWWGWLILTLNGFGTIVAAIKNGRELAAPGVELKKEVAEVKRQEQDHEADAERRFTEIKEHQDKQDATNQVILKTLFSLVNHEIDGNGVEKLKKARNELSDNIIDTKW